METEDERFRIRIVQGFPGTNCPRTDLMNTLFAAREREDRSEGRNRLNALWGRLFRLQRNEGPICRDLGPRKDMGNASIWNCGFGRFQSVESLVGPEANDGQAQRVYSQFVVLYVFAEYIRDAGGPSFPLQFHMIR